MTYQPLSPALLGVLALHGRLPTVVGIYGDLQTPAKVANIDPDTVPLIPLERAGLWLVSTSKGTPFDLVATFAGGFYVRHGANTPWTRVRDGCDVSEHFPAGYWKDARLQTLLPNEQTPTLPGELAKAARR